MNAQLLGTIRHPETFLRAAPAGFDGVFDWSWTKGCFGDTKIAPMDMDAVIERRGNFLVLETKSVGAVVPQGQLMTLKALHSLGRFTVMIIHGKSAPEVSQCWYPNSKKMAELHGVDEAREFVARWYRWADTKGGTA
jgi:hypothetical protein